MPKPLSDARVATWLAAAFAACVVLIPFHATLTVWLSQLAGHYTLLRLWKEILLVGLSAGALYLIIRDKTLRFRLIASPLPRLIAAYLLVQVVWGLTALALKQVTLQALAYGWVSDSRYLVFFLTGLVIAAKSPQLRAWWLKLVFWPAAVVISFGLLQYVALPYDFMKHLGYGPATIFPYEDINNNVHYLRIMSTLRGANPLGAYLVVVLSLAFAWLLKLKGKVSLTNRRPVAGLAALTAAGLVALVLTFSRSAWLGLALSVGVLAFIALHGRVVRKKLLLVALASGLVVALVGIAWRDNTVLQNIFLHTQSHSLVRATSDEGHASALQTGISDLAHEPLGRGPGTAGPASVYNRGHPTRIAENYFLQIGQETGWVGLALFVAIIALVARELWAIRRQTLALGLLAALAGVTVINLLSHAWADDTLAYLWWGLAAIALTTQYMPNERGH